MKEKHMEQSLCHHGVRHSNPLPVSKYTQPIRTKRQSSQYHQTASESFLKKKKEQRKSSQHKVTNARSLDKSSSSVCFFSLFLFPRIQEACGAEADMVACDAGCGGGDFGVCSESELILSCD